MKQRRPLVKPRHIHYEDFDLPEAVRALQREGIESFPNSEVAAFLRNKEWQVNFTKQSYRTINHWSKEGLLDERGRTTEKWRRFSIIDLAWIGILRELRDFGYPLWLLHQIKLRYYGKTQHSPLFTAGEFQFLEVLARKQSYLVCSNGSVIWTRTLEMESPVPAASLVINFNLLVQSAFENIQMPVASDLQRYDQERELLKKVRSGKYSSIEVKFHNGRMDRIEGTESVDPATQLRKIMMADKYQDIKVSLQDGKVVSIRKTSKEKVV